jgi:branched-chain amino acid transport system substrate-binding protein
MGGGRAAGGDLHRRFTPGGRPDHRGAAGRGQRLLAAAEGGEASYAGMEAYASAKVLVEGLRRAGPALMREGFVRALETMQRFDPGGLSTSRRRSAAARPAST